MTQEIVPVERAITIGGDLGGLKARYQTLVNATRDVLREGVDFGVIPGTTAKVLLKPGAEKLSTLFSLRPRFTLEDKLEDWDQGRFYYRYRCTLFNPNGEVIADSEGSCNSLEKKYRWREQHRQCPRCGQETIIKGKQEYGGGWLCWQKTGGCGAKFGDRAPEIVDQEIRRVENPEPFDLVNTLQKMAQKRALVAVVLVATGASEFFTQDIDEWEVVSSPTPAEEMDGATPTRRPEKQPKGTGRPLPPDRLIDFLSQKALGAESTEAASEKQAKFVAQKWEECYAPAEDSKNKYHRALNVVWGVDSATRLTKAQASATLDWLLTPDSYDLHPAAPTEAQALLREGDNSLR